VKGLSQGVYLMKMKVGEEVITKRIIKH
jgi:hypothetical protein